MSDENKLVYSRNAIVEVTREFEFDSCHKLLKYEGKCANIHGHTYKLQVTMEGKVDDIGIVMDFGNIERLVNVFVVNVLDHTDLNEVLDFNTTAENMSVWIYDVLKHKMGEIECFRNLKLTKIRLWETPNSYATYRGN